MDNIAVYKSIKSDHSLLCGECEASQNKLCLMRLQSAKWLIKVIYIFFCTSTYNFQLTMNRFVHLMHWWLDGCGANIVAWIQFCVSVLSAAYFVRVLRILTTVLWLLGFSPQAAHFYRVRIIRNLSGKIRNRIFWHVPRFARNMSKNTWVLESGVSVRGLFPLLKE